MKLREVKFDMDPNQEPYSLTSVNAHMILAI